MALDLKLKNLVGNIVPVTPIGIKTLTDVDFASTVVNGIAAIPPLDGSGVPLSSTKIRAIAYLRIKSWGHTDNVASVQLKAGNEIGITTVLNWGQATPIKTASVVAATTDVMTVRLELFMDVACKYIGIYPIITGTGPAFRTDIRWEFYPIS